MFRASLGVAAVSAVALTAALLSRGGGGQQVVVQPTAATVFRGFDAASTPASSVMDTWKESSPYTAVGVYLPVSKYDDRHDKTQQYLTPWWVKHVRNNGWSVIPIYLGLQAPSPCGSTAFWRMSADPGLAYAQGQAAATDAAQQVAKLGMETGTPIYYDMEAYKAGCSRSMQAFFQGWSTTLRAKGDLPGIYGSRASTMSDVTDLLTMPGCVRPSAIWPATNNGSTSTYGISPIPDTAWQGARINQYRLGHGESYGGKAVNIDSNVINGPVLPPSSAAPLAATKASTCVPGPPVDLKASRGSGKATLSWRAADSGGSKVTSYVVTKTAGPISQTTKTTSLSRVFTGLAMGSTYTFSVVATNALGASVANHVTVTMAGKPATPAAPRLAGKKKMLTIHWKWPSGNGSAITKVILHVSGKTYIRSAAADAITLKNLKPGTYKVAIQVVNGVGTSARSKIATATVVK